VKNKGKTQNSSFTSVGNTFIPSNKQIISSISARKKKIRDNHYLVYYEDYMPYKEGYITISFKKVNSINATFENTYWERNSPSSL